MRLLRLTLLALVFATAACSRSRSSGVSISSQTPSTSPAAQAEQTIPAAEWIPPQESPSPSPAAQTAAYDPFNLFRQLFGKFEILPSVYAAESGTPNYIEIPIVLPYTRLIQAPSAAQWYEITCANYSPSYARMFPGRFQAQAPLTIEITADIIPGAPRSLEMVLQTGPGIMDPLVPAQTLQAGASVSVTSRKVARGIILRIANQSSQMSGAVQCSGAYYYDGGHGGPIFSGVYAPPALH